MCFSATASFTAGTALSALGIDTLRHVRRKTDVPFAATPLLFGVQQFAEGVIWLSLNNPAVLSTMSFVYLLFSHVFWPVSIPLSVFLMEPKGWRRTALGFCTFVGIVVGAYFLYYLLNESVTTEVLNRCIAYSAPHFAQTFVLSPYAVATCVSCLFSSHRFINLFGVGVFLSSIVANAFFVQSYVSVWCFFAAIVSALIWMHFRFDGRAKS